MTSCAVESTGSGGGGSSPRFAKSGSETGGAKDCQSAGRRFRPSERNASADASRDNAVVKPVRPTKSENDVNGPD